MRLIDADVLHTLLVKINDFGELSAKKAIRMVRKAPTVDAVPVTRCRDCKHRDEQTANCTRFRKDWYVQSDSFCSWAERKEE